MKAIATLAVLGLAYAGERRENPRFRIDSKVVTANNNKDVLHIDMSKDIPNMPGVQTTVISKDLKDLLPAGLRDLVKDVKVDHRVFTAQNNSGDITINMDDADNELSFVLKPKPWERDYIRDRNPDFVRRNIADDELVYIPGKQWGPGMHIMDDADNELIGVTWKHKDINGDHNSGRMDININNDDADNELIGVTWKHKDINGDHNSGRMDININNDDADNELLLFPKPRAGERDYLRDRNPQPFLRNVADDELAYVAGKQAPTGFYQGFYHIMDDADNELRSTTKIHANDNRGMMQIMGNDDELFLDFTNKHNHVNANHNSGMMNININNDDELMMVPRWRNDIRRPVATAEADDELFLDLTNKHTHVNANHNSGMMNIRVNNDDADNELASWNTENIYFPKRQGGPDYVHVKTETHVNGVDGNTGVRIIQRDDADDELVYIPGKQVTQGFYHIMDDADNELRSTTKIHANDNNGMINIMGHDDELFLDFTNKHNHVNANHNSGMMNIHINNDDELFLDFTNKHNHVNANHNSGMMNIHINNDDELMQLADLIKGSKINGLRVL